MSAPEAVTASFDNSTGVFTSKGNTDGYTVDGKTVTYSDATSQSVTFTGYSDEATEKSFNVSGTTVRVGKTAVKTDGTPLTLAEDGYTLELGNGMSAPEAVAASFDNSTGVFTSKGNTDGYTVDGKTVTYSDATSQSVTFTGYADTATEKSFNVSGTTVRVGKTAVDTDGTPLTLAEDGYTIELGNGMTAPEAVEAAFDNSTGVFISKGKTDGYTVDGKTVTYSDATSQSVTFTGYADTATEKSFNVSGTTVRVGKTAVDTDGTPLTLAEDGYTLELGNGMTAPEAVEAAFDKSTGIFISKGKTDGYTVDGKTVAYSDATSQMVTFTGYADTATEKSFNVSGTTVRVGKTAVDTDGTPLTLAEDGYTLELGNGMSAPEAVAASFDNSTGVFTSKGNTDGYTVDGKTVTYSDATSQSVTFTGYADTATEKSFNVSGTTVRVGKTAVDTDGTPLTLAEDGYTLELGNGMNAPEAVAASFENGVFTSKGKTAGYTVDGKTVTYDEATSKSVEVEGYASTATAKSFNISGNVLRIGKTAVSTDGTPLTVKTDGYTLELGNGMNAPETVAASFEDGVFTSKGKTAGYTVDGKTVTYDEATSKSVEVEGYASTATAKSFNISGNVLRVGKTAVSTDGTALTIKTDGYTLELGNGMNEQAAAVDKWSDITNGSVSYLTDYTEAGYTLSSDKTSVSYDKGGSTTSLKLSGVAAGSTLAAVSKGTVQLSAANIDSNLKVDSNAGKYKLSMTKGTYTNQTLTGSSGADTITNAGNGLAIHSGKGNDSIVSSGNNARINSGDGNDYIKLTGTAATLVAGAGNDSLWAASGSGSYVVDGGKGNDILRGGKGVDSLVGGAGNDSLYGNAGDDRLNGGTGKDLLDGGAGNDVLNGGDDNDTVLGGAGNDTMYGGKGADSLEGGAGADLLYGGAGNDTLWGGAGNDSLYGDAGNDVFIYKPGEGKDTIYDYESGDMLQILNSDGSTGGTFSSSALRNGQLTLNISGGGSVVIDDVSNGDVINVNGTNRTVRGNRLR